MKNSKTFKIKDEEYLRTRRFKERVLLLLIKRRVFRGNSIKDNWIKAPTMSKFFHDQQWSSELPPLNLEIF